MTPPDPTRPAVPGPVTRALAPAARRGVLAAAAFALPLLAAGCKGLGVLGAPPRPLPDVTVVREAIAGEQLMIARYRAVLARSPGLSTSLAAMLAEHQAHLAALRARLVGPHADIPRGRAARGGPPTTPSAAIAYLRNAERGAAASLLAHLGGAPPSLAQLLASIAASESTHAAMLAGHRAHG